MGIREPLAEVLASCGEDSQDPFRPDGREFEAVIQYLDDMEERLTNAVVEKPG